MRKFTDMPAEAFNEIVKNAGILIKGSSGFDPTNRSYSRSDIIGATSGGINFSDAIEYEDFGEDIDNCPKNTKELKEIKSREVKSSGTFVTIDNGIAKMLMAAADVDEVDSTHIVPRDVLESEDFDDIWFVTDYSAEDGGFVALHLMDCLSTGGFQIQSSDGAKGTFAFEITAHYTMADINRVPYEVYISEGTESSEYTEATLTSAGFQSGVVYYTRTGSGTSESPYVFTKVTGTYNSSVTYYIKA